MLQNGCQSNEKSDEATGHGVTAKCRHSFQIPWSHLGHMDAADLGAEGPLPTWAFTPETSMCALWRALQGAQAAGLSTATVEEPTHLLPT